MKTKKDLKPFGSLIQVCPECGKIDVYLDDGHDCEAEYIRKINSQYEY